MAVSAIEFWQQLSRIGIVDDATATAWNARFKALLAKRAESGGDRGKPLADDATSAAQFLIASRVLTKFQSQRLIAGRAAELRLADYLIVDRCDQSPLSRWYAARDVRDGADCFVYPCTDALTSARWVDPEWLAPHGAVTHSALQTIEVITLAKTDPWRGAIVSKLPAGRPLNQWAADHGKLDSATTAAIGQVLANALAALHESGLVHGELRPSRIWCGDDRSLWLLRDAGRPPAIPTDQPQEHRWFDDDSVGSYYAAPELADSGAEPSFSSDLYSLGAVLFELTSGRRLHARPFEGAIPPEVTEASELGASGDLLMRTLAFAIDPDPDARFADVASFARALGVVATAAPAVTAADPPVPAPVPTATEEKHVAAPEQVASPSVSAMTSSASTEGKRPREDASVRPDSKAKASVASKSESKTAASPVDSKKKITAAASPASPTGATLEQGVAATKPKVAAKSAPVSSEAAVTPGTASNAIPATKVSPRPVGLSAASVAAPAAAVAPASAVSEAAKPATAAGEVAATSNPAANTAPSAPAAPASPARRRRNRRTRRGPIIVGSIAAVVLLGIVGLFLRPGDTEPAPRPRPTLPPRVATTNAPANSTTKAGATASASLDAAASDSGYELVQDDRLLWAPPWTAKSKSPSLELIPPGSQLVVSIRLSRLISGATGTRWLDWLGPELTPALAVLEKRAGVKASDIDRLTIATTGSTAGLKTCYAVVLHNALPLKTLTDAWAVSPSRTRDGKTIYSNEDPMSDVFFIATDPKANAGEVRQYAFGPSDQMALVAENDGAAIPLPRSLQQLWDTTSDEADVVAMTTPNFLFADGRDLLKLYAPRATEPLRGLLIPDVAGVTLSMSLVDQWYLETKFAPSGNVTAPVLLQTIKPRIDELPTWADAFAVDANVDTSWKAIAIRLPQYMRALSDQTRYGVSATLPMANAYLPMEAAPQVALATLLALSAPETAPTVAAAAEPAAMEALTAAQMLDRPFSVSFDQESLEFAVAAIRDEFIRALPQGAVPPTITIIGGDLEKMGITQNQQIRNFQIRDKPLRDALTELVRQANPDKSVTSLTDPKQSLVWAVDSQAPADKPTILITTRPAVETKGLALTKEFTGAE